MTGLVASVGDVEALRDSVSAVVRDPATREEMSENCLRVAAEVRA